MALERCADCDFSLIDFCLQYRGKTRDLLDVCVRHKLILDQKDCELCGKPAVLDFNQRLWRCQKVNVVTKKKKAKCSWKESIFKNTFLQRSMLDIETVLLFINVYLRECFSYVFVQSELKISDPTICDWAGFCREVLTEWWLNRKGKIGGEGKVVEIYETQFGKRKHNVGRLEEGQWVFGGVCRQTRQCFMVPVEQRDSASLSKVIKDRILPGTTITSDFWKEYTCLQDEDYTHLSVNHAINFVNSNTKDACTKNIERLWTEAKRKVPPFGRKEKHSVGYLARSMFLMAIEDPNKRFHIFLQEAAALYNPYNPPQ